MIDPNTGVKYDHPYLDPQWKKPNLQSTWQSIHQVYHAVPTFKKFFDDTYAVLGVYDSEAPEWFIHEFDAKLKANLDGAITRSPQYRAENFNYLSLHQHGSGDHKTRSMAALLKRSDVK